MEHNKKTAGNRVKNHNIDFKLKEAETLQATSLQKKF